MDEVNGFATVGAGNLAPQTPNEQVSTMVSETDRLARAFVKRGMPVLAFLDTHEPGKPEPPYPPHCELGTGEEDLVPELKWLEEDPHATLVRKDCINGFIGAYQKDNSNAVIDWVRGKKFREYFGCRHLYGYLCNGFCFDASLCPEPRDDPKFERSYSL
ncbi:MAG: hypothetical protein CM1200mP30_07940 [Pseudomonadota bacterium]|nr:MAG: hypothetical protein CM1200mP30_07940 [Pseudomonadota bacterium]